MPIPPPESGLPREAEPPEDAAGMGSTPSGPSFAPGSWQPRWSEPVGRPPATRPDPATYTPRRSRLPAALTAVAVGLVAIVVAVASLLAHRADQVATPIPRRTVISPQVSPTLDSIEFTTRTGAGRLTIVDHSWQEARNDPGTALLVEIRIECTSGSVDYDPFDFQAFDASGNLFELAAEEIRGEMLGVGILQAGEQTKGEVAFVIPRGEVTLLMSDDTDSVTALKVPD
jgi:hypothetical protein